MTEKELAKYFTPVEADTRAPVLDKEILRTGALVRYNGAKTVATRGPNAMRDSNTLHAFGVLGAPEPRAFQLWGTGALNNQLGKVKAGSIIFISYRGKQTPDDASDVAVHQWSVSVATSTRYSDLPDEVRTTFGAGVGKLVAAIDAAAEKEAREFAARSQGGRNVQPGDDAGYYAALEASAP